MLSLAPPSGHSDLWPSRSAVLSGMLLPQLQRRTAIPSGSLVDVKRPRFRRRLWKDTLTLAWVAAQFRPVIAAQPRRCWLAVNR